MVDDEKLEILIKSLQAYRSAMYLRMQKIESVIHELSSIEYVDGDIIDPGTGMAMTDERRQLVYDCCVKEAEKLLA